MFYCLLHTYGHPKHGRESIAIVSLICVPCVVRIGADLRTAGTGLIGQRAKRDRNAADEAGHGDKNARRLILLACAKGR